MAVSVVPALKLALFQSAREVIPSETAIVSYGVAVTNDPGDYLMIGVDDPDDAEASGTTATTREWETVGIQADVREVGDIPCTALSWNGGSDDDAAIAACTDVYAIAEALAAVVRANPNLGLQEVSWALFGAETELTEIQDASGAKARLKFTIHYQALI